MTKTPRIIVGVCRECVDYVFDGAALYRHGADYLHYGNDSVRCPGQEDDETDDRANLMSFEVFREEWGDTEVTEVLVDLFGELARNLKIR
jgi:hypothetical protein